MELIKKSKTVAVILDIIAALLPLAVVVFGIILLLGGFLLTLSHGLIYFVFPGLFAWYCIRKRRGEDSAWEKVFYIGLAWVLLVVVFVPSLVVSPFRVMFDTKGEAAVQEFCAQIEYVEPESLSSAEKFHYYEYSTGAAVFVSTTNVLVCTYDEAEYEKQKALLDETYVFQSEPLSKRYFDGEDSVAIPAETELDGVRFRALSLKDEVYPGLCYPRYIMLIATDDANNEIIYIYFDDPDLDYIESLDDFILKSCGWKYIR